MSRPLIQSRHAGKNRGATIRFAAGRLHLHLLLAPLALLAPAEAFASPPDQIEQAQSERSSEELARLSRDPVWLALLHQARRPLNADSRQALHDVGFFFHSEGGREPTLELTATLAAFETPDVEKARVARCAFPARHLFLVQHGLIKGERGACPELDPWRAEIGEVDLTLIFPEAFLGSPASMFGHTLLRFDPIDPSGASRQDPLLGWALDYTASSQGQVGAIFLIKGLIGGYRGRFSLTPYYQKTQVYGDWQDRDIWEYPLHMEPEARERLLLHIWELRDVSLPYYFFTQNCSEKLVELLEVGWPDLGRGGGFPPAVTPVDTVRAIAGYGDTLGEPILRPSPATSLQDSMQEISRRGARLVDALANGRIPTSDPSLQAVDPELRARILTLSYDLLRHRYLANQVSEDDSRSRSRDLLVARSQIPLRTPVESGKVSGNRRRPDHGHRTARVGLGGGIQDDEGFVELHLQPSYHTALDAPGGFAEGGVIKALETRVRYFPELERVRLHEFVLLDVSTASPWRRPFRPIGWHLDLGLRTRLFASKGHGLETAGIFRAQGGVGAALAPARGLHLYGFGELALEAAPDIRGKISVGPILRSGFSYSTPKGFYTLHTEGIAGVLTGPHTDPWFKAQINQRASISENWSAVLNTSYERAYGVDFLEAHLGLVRYF